MKHLEQAMTNKELTDAEKVALVILTISGDKTTKELTEGLDKQSQHITRIMRKLETMGLVSGYKRTVAGRQGWDKVYAIVL